jgi:hypothetical protein
MPPDGTDYIDSRPLGNRERPGNTWKSLGDLARALVERAAK